MDELRFDSLTRSLATPKTRRGILGGLAALVVGARAASAQAACPIPGQIRNAKGKCSCPAGTDATPTGCFDLKRDPGNCGAVGIACPADAACVKGTCVCPAGGCTTTTTTTTTPSPAGTCAAGANRCSVENTSDIACNSVDGCFCYQTVESTTVCGLPRVGSTCGECESSADCVQNPAFGPGSHCIQTAGGVCGCEPGQDICVRPC